MIGTSEYRKFDQLVKVGRQQLARRDATVIMTAFKLRALLYDILKPWTANNIAAVMREFESGIDRMGMPKQYLFELWVGSIFGYKEHTLYGEMRNISLKQFVNKLRENYGAKDE